MILKRPNFKFPEKLSFLLLKGSIKSGNLHTIENGKKATFSDVKK